MPLRFIRSKVSGVDPLQAAITTTKLSKDLLSTLQFPPAVAVVSVVLLILETAQSIQANKTDCDRLARRAAQILIDIDGQMRGRWTSAPERLLLNLQKFEGTLRLIYEFMKQLADWKWSDRFLRKGLIDDALAEYSKMMEDAAQSFQLATLIDLHYTVETLSRKGTTISEIQESQESVQPPPYTKKTSHESSIPEVKELDIRGPPLPTVAGVIVSEPTELSNSPIAESQTEEPIAEISTVGIKDSLNDHYLPEEMSSLTLDDDHGFRRYHQSEVMLRGRSRLKTGWWSGATEVQVQGQPALIKKYDNPKEKAYREWLRDVKMLQNLYHPCLPQMLGFSDEDTPTPFILLSNVKTQTPEALVREKLRTGSLASCMELMLRFYRDLADTAFYVQRQLNLTESQVQDFFEAAGFRVDSQKTLVVGLPPPREGTWYSARNYGLAHTLLSACLHMLPNRGRVTYSHDHSDEDVTEDMQKKINHLVTLARSLLPSGSQSPELSPKLQELIEDNDFETPSLTLRQVRDLTFHAGGHDHSWYERNVPANKFFVGDLGYIPTGKGWDSFVRLSNVVEDDAVALKVSFKSVGEHWCWENTPIRRQPLQVFDMPMNISGWPVAVPPHKQIDVVVIHEAFVASVKTAWQYLLEHGKKIAFGAGIKPEELVLVTHAGTHQDFYIRDVRPQPFGMNRNMQLSNPRFGANQFHHQHMQGGSNQPSGFGFQPHFNQPTMPSIVYLFTALSPSHEPYWSSSPMCALPGSERPPLDRHFTYKIGYQTGFLNYVQLHAEDFDSR